MEGGAWHSDVYDNGRDFQKTRAQGGAQGVDAMEAGSTPAMYNPSPVLLGKDSAMFGVLTVSLRAALVLFSLIAFSVMAANKATIYDAYYGVYSTSIYKSTVKFSAVKAFVGLLSLDTIVCFYAIVQLVLCIIQLGTNGTFISSATSWRSLLTFAIDTVLAYALIAAAGAASAAQALLSENSYCHSIPGFCHKAQASIAMSFFAFAIIAASAALYPVRLLRLSKRPI